jgi:hypothetical protein
MHQGCGLDRMLGTLAAQTSLRDLPQLGIYRLDDLVIRILVAGGPGVKKLGYFRRRRWVQLTPSNPVVVIIYHSPVSAETIILGVRRPMNPTILSHSD